MDNAEQYRGQQPAGAAFLGARRAESYFEEWPTELGGEAGSSTPDEVVRFVPRMGDKTAPEADMVDEDESAEESEALLLRMSQPEPPQPAPAASRVEAAQPALPAAPAAPRRGLFARRGPTKAQLAAQQLNADRNTIRLASWARSVGVLVANPKGGVGKTPSALILGGVLASIRGGQTCVFEVTDDAGALAVRAEGPATAGMAELVRDVGAIRGAGQLAGYVSQQTSYAAVVGTVYDRAPLSHVDVQNVSDLLGFFYPIRVMDSGNQASSSAFHGAVNSADVLVIPVLEAIDSVNGAHQLVRFLHRYGGHPAALAQNAIALRIDDGRTVAPDVRAYVTDALEAAGIRQVVNIPYDPHIAQRSTITLDRLRVATVDAYTRAGATVINQLTKRLNH